MDVEELAQQVLCFANRDDRGVALVIRAGPDQLVYFRFSDCAAEPACMLSWEARPHAAGSDGVPPRQVAWLSRMYFRRDGEGPAGRVVRMPGTIEDARVVAGLVSFLLEHAYELPVDAVVSLALE